MTFQRVCGAAAVVLVSMAQMSAESNQVSLHCGAPTVPSTAVSSAAASSTAASPATAPADAGGTPPHGDIARGAYLAQHVAMCVECHSGRDSTGAIVESERFMGGPIPLGPPWAGDWAPRAPRNRGLPGYTDEEGIRLLTRGAIDRQGRQLRPPMPRFRMTPQDAADIVAFLKSL